MTLPFSVLLPFSVGMTHKGEDLQTLSFRSRSCIVRVLSGQQFSSYRVQGQGHNHFRGQIVPKTVLLITYRSKFDETSQKDKA